MNILKEVACVEKTNSNRADRFKAYTTILKTDEWISFKFSKVFINNLIEDAFSKDSDDLHKTRSLSLLSKIISTNKSVEFSKHEVSRIMEGISGAVANCSEELFSILIGIVRFQKLNPAFMKSEVARLYQSICTRMRSIKSSKFVGLGLGALLRLYEQNPSPFISRSEVWFEAVGETLNMDALAVKKPLLLFLNAISANIDPVYKSVFEENASKFITPAHFHKLRECISGSHKPGIYCVQIWAALVKILGSVLYKANEYTNRFLSIAERAFKSPHPAVQQCMYENWKCLIDAFSQDKSIIHGTKRLTLLLQPLLCCKSQNIDVVLAAAQCWVHLISSVSQFLPEILPNVFFPCISFCFKDVWESCLEQKSSKDKLVELRELGIELLINFFALSRAENQECSRYSSSLFSTKVSSIEMVRCAVEHAEVVIALLIKAFVLREVIFRHSIVKLFTVFSEFINTNIENYGKTLTSPLLMLKKYIEEICEVQSESRLFVWELINYLNSLHHRALNTCLPVTDQLSRADKPVSLSTAFLRIIFQEKMLLLINRHVDFFATIESLIETLFKSAFAMELINSCLEHFISVPCSTDILEYLLKIWVRLAEKQSAYLSENGLSFSDKFAFEVTYNLLLYPTNHLLRAENTEFLDANFPTIKTKWNNLYSRLCNLAFLCVETNENEWISYLCDEIINGIIPSENLIYYDFLSMCLQSMVMKFEPLFQTYKSPKRSSNKDTSLFSEKDELFPLKKWLKAVSIVSDGFFNCFDAKLANAGSLGEADRRHAADCLCFITKAIHTYMTKLNRPKFLMYSIPLLQKSLISLCSRKYENIMKISAVRRFGSERESMFKSIYDIVNEHPYCCDNEMRQALLPVFRTMIQNKRCSLSKIAISLSSKVLGKEVSSMSVKAIKQLLGAGDSVSEDSQSNSSAVEDSESQSQVPIVLPLTPIRKDENRILKEVNSTGINNKKNSFSPKRKITNENSIDDIPESEFIHVYSAVKKPRFLTEHQLEKFSEQKFIPQLMDHLNGPISNIDYENSESQSEFEAVSDLPVVSQETDCDVSKEISDADNQSVMIEEIASVDAGDHSYPAISEAETNFSSEIEFSDVTKVEFPLENGVDSPDNREINEEDTNKQDGPLIVFVPYAEESGIDASCVQGDETDESADETTDNEEPQGNEATVLESNGNNTHDPVSSKHDVNIGGTVDPLENTNDNVIDSDRFCDSCSTIDYTPPAHMSYIQLSLNNFSDSVDKMEKEGQLKSCLKRISELQLPSDAENVNKNKFEEKRKVRFSEDVKEYLFEREKGESVCSSPRLSLPLYRNNSVLVLQPPATARKKTRQRTSTRCKVPKFGNLINWELELCARMSETSSSDLMNFVEKQERSSDESIFHFDTPPLTSTEPVYSPLAQCRIPLNYGNILKNIWNKGMTKALEKSGIFTLGDLCSLPVYEIARFPLAKPKVETFLRLIRQHHMELEKMKQEFEIYLRPGASAKYHAQFIAQRKKAYAEFLDMYNNCDFPTPASISSKRLFQSEQQPITEVVNDENKVSDSGAVSTLEEVLGDVTVSIEADSEKVAESVNFCENHNAHSIPLEMPNGENIIDVRDSSGARSPDLVIEVPVSTFEDDADVFGSRAVDLQQLTEQLDTLSGSISASLSNLQTDELLILLERLHSFYGSTCSPIIRNLRRTSI